MGCITSLESLGTSTKKNSYHDKFYNCNVYAHQGYHRKQMQDKYAVCLNIPNHPQYSLFGIFDGFNGDSASSYLSEHLVNVLNDLSDLDNDNIIIDAIQNMDRQWLSEPEANNAGSTLVFAVIKVIPGKQSDKTSENHDNIIIDTIQNKTSFNNSFSIFQPNLTLQDYESYPSQASQISDIFNTPKLEDYPSYQSLPPSEIDANHDFDVRIFWAGDSRAITIGKEGDFESLTIDHNCNLELETKRIKNANGRITNNRIDGIVAVSRGFGCQVMKNNNNLAQNEQKIISVAECKHITCKQNDTLLIFCDGLIAPNWDNEIINKNYNRILEQHKNEKHANLNSLVYLTEQAHDAGSTDNITTMSIQFQ
jgi:serine/threonine protein phosphatase PrpC